MKDKLSENIKNEAKRNDFLKSRVSVGNHAHKLREKNELN